MSASLISRNVVIDSQRTSFRLEPEMWTALEHICEMEGVDIHTLCTWISKYKPRANRTSAIRAFIVRYLWELAQINEKTHVRSKESRFYEGDEMSTRLYQLLSAA